MKVVTYKLGEQTFIAFGDDDRNDIVSAERFLEMLGKVENTLNEPDNGVHYRFDMPEASTSDVVGIARILLAHQFGLGNEDESHQ